MKVHVVIKSSTVFTMSSKFLIICDLMACSKSFYLSDSVITVMTTNHVHFELKPLPRIVILCLVTCRTRFVSY